MSQQLHYKEDVAMVDINRNHSEALANTLSTLMAALFQANFKIRAYHERLSGFVLWDYDLLLASQSNDVAACMGEVSERLRALKMPQPRLLQEVLQRPAKRRKIANETQAALMAQDLLDDQYKLAELLKSAQLLADERGDDTTSKMADKWTAAAHRHACRLLAIQ